MSLPVSIEESLDALFLDVSQACLELDREWVTQGVLSALTCPSHHFENRSFAETLGIRLVPYNTPPPGSPPSGGLHALQSSFDALFATLVQEVRELRTLVTGSKAPLSKGAVSSTHSAPSKPSTMPKPTAPSHAMAKPAPSTPPSCPSFASVTRAPAWPSLVIKQTATFTPDGDSIIVVTLSAAWWMKASLVVMAGPDTTAHHLNAASHFISDTLAPFLSANPSAPLPVSSRENVRWSHLLINRIPTGVTDTCGAYTPSECHDALAADNPIYCTLRLMQLPSQDLNGETLKALLADRTLFTFGHTGELKCWKQKPQGKPCGTDASHPSS
ncbi:hypothetical protein EI94DRAFT_1796014 [Lactarius quietus]|nr:hypothetical protein EI94DRAFT_1796014 [Lactarius quietus]